MISSMYASFRSPGARAATYSVALLLSMSAASLAGTPAVNAPVANPTVTAVDKIVPGSAADCATQAVQADAMRIHYRTVKVGEVSVFYREAGPKDGPKVLLLHGWGASSFMFRNLIPFLATKYHVIAPDLPGFGLTEAPAHDKFAYSFDHLAEVMDRFTDAVKFDRYAMYVFDYGAPTGYRLAIKHPDRITAIISQNGNAYEQGLSKGWEPIQRYWKEPTQANRDALRSFMTLQTNRWQYTEGVKDPTLIEPEAYQLSQQAFDRLGNMEAQLDLFGDYKSNVTLYPTFQQYFRDRKPPILAVWGKNDPFFLPAGATAYAKDDPNAEVFLFDTGHLALETHNDEIAVIIVKFLDRVVE